MELWDAYDKYRKPLGYKIIRGEKIPDEARHIVAHIVIVNSKGEILMQRRALDKDLAPGLWAFTGGSAVSGETTYEACLRETEEELGFTPDMSTAEMIISYSTEDTFVDVYLIYSDIGISELTYQEHEVCDAMWLNREAFWELYKDPKKFWRYRYISMLDRFLIDRGIWKL